MSVDATPGTQPNTVLSRELADFLIELSIALNKRTMYPGDHPSLEADQGRVMRRLTALLVERQSLAVGVAHDQLIIEGIATDPRNPLLRGLAHHLHRHHIGAAKFLAGTRGDEISDMLRALAADADRYCPILGMDSATGAPRWEHIRLFPLTYDQLELIDDGEEASLEVDRQPWSAQLWLDLARAALQAESSDDKPPTDPAVVAEAINSHAREQAYDQVIVGYLLKIAGELRSGEHEDSAILQRRVSGLVRALDPEQLRQLLAMGGDVIQRRRFVLDASHGMAVDAVLTLVQAASDVSQRTISSPLLRMFTKLAAHAERGTEHARPEAESALRDHVQELIAEWDLSDPTPGQYGAVLERAARDTPLFLVPEESTHPCEPERLLQMSLEVGSVGAQITHAVDAMIAEERIGAVFDLLEQAPEPNDALEGILQQLSTPERLRPLLDAEPLDLDRVTLLAHRMGADAADPLLDLLASTDSRATRRRLLDLLAQLGADIGPVVVARLPDAPWYFQRNLLVLLDQLPAWPEGFDLDPYLAHLDARVRREAVRMQLKAPAERERTICSALHDADEQVVRLALTAALDGCPAAALPTIVERLNRRALDTELELLALRVVAQVPTPASHDCLLRYAMPPRGWFRRRRLAPVSPRLLVTLAALAAHWPREPRTVAALSRAALHTDPELRSAVASWQGAA
jgi:hypothetical protein